MKELIEYIAKSIVDKPEEVQVVETRQGEQVVIVLKVHPDDRGKVIGRQGRIAEAMRVLLRVAAVRSGNRAMLQIE